MTGNRKSDKMPCKFMALTTTGNVKTEIWAYTAFPVINMKILLRSRGYFVLIVCVVKRNCQSGRFSGSKQCFYSCKHPALVMIVLYLSIFSPAHSAINIPANPLFISETEAFSFVDFLTYRRLLALG